MTPKDALLLHVKGLGRILRFAQDRAGGLRPEPQEASQPKALVTLRDDSDEPSIWTHTICGCAIILIVAAYHIATWRL